MVKVTATAEGETAPLPEPTIPAPEPASPDTEDYVEVVITKAGAHKVHTGGKPGETYDRGAKITVTRATAESLEARHFVEID